MTEPEEQRNKHYQGCYYQPLQLLEIWPSEINFTTEDLPRILIKLEGISMKIPRTAAILPAACLETRVTMIKMILHIVDVAKTQNYPQTIPVNIVMEILKDATEDILAKQEKLYILLDKANQWYKGPSHWIEG